MENIGERIRKIRLDKDLTQEMFAEMLNVKRGIISANEIGSRAVSQRTIKAICREFGVNETWLLTGEGEMYILDDETKIQQVIDEYGLSYAQAKLFKVLIGMPEDKIDAILAAARNLVEEFDKEE